MNSLESIHHALKEHIVKLFPVLAHEKVEKIELQLNTDPSKQQFGDLSSNCALIIAREIKQNPLTVAQTIADSFTHPALKQIAIVSNFLNMTLTQEAFRELGAKLYTEKERFF